MAGHRDREGMSDPEVIALARTEHRAVVTNNLRDYRPLHHEAAYGLQAVALAFGPLTLVAPIVAADLLFALPLAARWSRRPLRPRDWAGCLLVAAGVAVFLAVAPPSAGRAAVPAAGWLLAFGIVVVMTALAVGLGRVTGQSARAGLLAAAAGVVFGLTAAVTASFVRSLRQEGVGSVLAHSTSGWPPPRPACWPSWPRPAWRWRAS